MTEALTSPEYHLERIARKRIVAELIKCGGCQMCQHRHEWTCTTTSRSFPLCVKDGGNPGFLLDEETI